jgi:hypothetical protein
MVLNGEERLISANVELDHIHPTHKDHRLVFRLRNWTSQWTICPLPAGLLVRYHDEQYRIHKRIPKFCSLFLSSENIEFNLQLQQIIPISDTLYVLTFLSTNIINHLYAYTHCFIFNWPGLSSVLHTISPHYEHAVLVTYGVQFCPISETVAA